MSAALVATALVAVPTIATADHGSTDDTAGCARKFDDAQRVGMESFRDFDREAFEDRNAAWTWTAP